MTCSSRPLRIPGSVGFTLVEMMIAITLGMIVLLAVSLLFLNSSRSRMEIQRSSQQIESTFFGVHALQEDLRLAGFWGEMNPSVVTTPGALPDPCSTSVATDMPVFIQGVNDVTAGTTPSCIPESVVTGTDIVVLRRASTCFAGASDCEDSSSVTTRQYLQVSLCGNEPSGTPSPTTHRLLAGNPADHTSGQFDLHVNCPSTTPIGSVAYASVRRARVHIYYVAANNLAGDGVPSLKRLELDGSSGTGWTVTTIAEGIQNFQVEYGLDSSGDGAADSFSATPATVADWMSVTQAKVFLLGRNLDQAVGYTDSKTYCLRGDHCADGTGLLGPFPDAYKRHVASSEIRLVNSAGRKE